MIYITGGNQGARIINRAVVKALPELLQKYRIIHQCGKLDYNRITYHISHITPHLRKRYWLTDYVEPKDIGWVFNQADLVISRAGANIISELAALGKPAILIPIPWSFRNEQEENAQMLVDAGTAIILPQTRLTGRKLQAAIEKVMANLDEYKASAARAKSLVNPEAVRKIINQIDYVCKR